MGGCNCGPFGIAYAAQILNGKLSKKDYLDINEMQRYLILCLEKQELRPFPKLRRS